MNTIKSLSKIKFPPQEYGFLFQILHENVLSNRAESRSSSKKRKPYPCSATAITLGSITLFFEDASHFHQTHKEIKHIQKHRHHQKSKYYKSVFFFFLIFIKPYCQNKRSRCLPPKKRKPHPCLSVPLEHP